MTVSPRLPQCSGLSCIETLESNRVELGRMRRELEDRQLVSGRDQLAHCLADVDTQVSLDHNDGSAELLVGGAQKPGIVLIINPCAGHRDGRSARGRSAGMLT
jgi:hypothetical protein